MVREVKGQPKWFDRDLTDLRHVDLSLMLNPPSEITAGNSEEEALDILCKVLGVSIEQPQRIVSSKIGGIKLIKDSLNHIVEKRRDARERYVNFALEAMNNPFEIWKVAYDDESFRYAFIGLFKGKVQMLVIISIVDGLMLWNFMQSNAKNLNKHRHGELIYQKTENKKAAIEAAAK